MNSNASMPENPSYSHSLKLEETAENFTLEAGHTKR
jgi:hypothetical protein